jgi:transcriptional regulator with XRE-family HTH domain
MINYQNSVSRCQQQTDCNINHNPDMDTLAKRMRAERTRLGMSQAELAKRASCGQSLIGNLESGQLTSAKIPRIAAVFGVSAVWLAEGTGARETQKKEAPASREPDATYDANAKRLLAAFFELPETDKEWLVEIAEVRTRQMAGARSPRPDGTVAPRRSSTQRATTQNKATQKGN